MQYDEKLLQDAADFANSKLGCAPASDDIDRARKVLVDGYFDDEGADDLWDAMVVGFVGATTRGVK